MIELTPDQAAFLEQEHSAAMVTVDPDGVPKVRRVAVAVVDGRVWSSGVRGWARTERLRVDPRCTLFVYDQGSSWLALEGTVTVLDDDEVPARHVQLFRVMQGRPTGPLTWFDGELEVRAFLRTMIEEERVIYELDVARAYGSLAY